MKGGRDLCGEAKAGAGRFRTWPVCLATALVFGSTLALADESVPDVKGPWTGKSHTIVAGTAPHWQKNAGTFANPGLAEKDVVIDIAHQEGRRFWGTITLTKDDEKTVTPFIGELYGSGNHKVLVAQDAGVLQGEIEGDTLSYCFSLADGLGPTKSSVVSCTEVRRAK